MYKEKLLYNIKVTLTCSWRGILIVHSYVYNLLSVHLYLPPFPFFCPDNEWYHVIHVNSSIDNDAGINSNNKNYIEFKTL